MLAARSVKPDIAISLDVTLAGDTRDLSSRYDDLLGRGPCVQLYSFHGRGTLNGTLPHEGLFKLAKECAAKINCSFQRFAALGILTDSSYIQLEGKGVACLEMGFPARYTHSPVEVCDIQDITELARLAAAMMRGIGRNFKLDRL
jgi:putative aminopeptidase FrvX